MPVGKHYENIIPVLYSAGYLLVDFRSCKESYLQKAASESSQNKRDGLIKYLQKSETKQMKLKIISSILTYAIAWFLKVLSRHSFPCCSVVREACCRY